MYIIVFLVSIFVHSCCAMEQDLEINVINDKGYNIISYGNLYEKSLLFNQLADDAYNRYIENDLAASENYKKIALDFSHKSILYSSSAIKDAKNLHKNKFEAIKHAIAILRNVVQRDEILYDAGVIDQAVDLKSLIIANLDGINLEPEEYGVFFS